MPVPAESTLPKAEREQIFISASVEDFSIVHDYENLDKLEWQSCTHSGTHADAARALGSGSGTARTFYDSTRSRPDGNDHVPASLSFAGAGAGGHDQVPPQQVQVQQQHSHHDASASAAQQIELQDGRQSLAATLRTSQATSGTSRTSRTSHASSSLSLPLRVEEEDSGDDGDEGEGVGDGDDRPAVIYEDDVGRYMQSMGTGAGAGGGMLVGDYHEDNGTLCK